ncbi:MAG: [protein-PII] uridylyltransferase [Candidatus Muproteobacteria bacterium RBG_16_65_34]|uniref:Bifunctional uridylyltransferase/uridylyl-removing enzyme n=1 Tax=Candidatus Muproteobacteria bacterium RBG_16_65_34 TaxID=1817760 RepID=A0A1F6TMV2_9PROT|nr:MAG: [protein-PII] uridylyltransferase [Candidatus Muproteobacteria bacterium RBG_16_65_34]
MTLGKNALLDVHALAQSVHASASPLAPFREALRGARERLKRRYFEKPDAAPRLVALYAWLVDQLLIHAWRLHERNLPVGARSALVAVGGYGRGELHPASDIDLMLLLDKDGPEKVREFVETLIRFLWDMGLEVGHSVRTVKDCVREARADLSVATNLMEARLLAGDAGLFERMRAAVHASKIWPSKKFFAAKLAEQAERHHHFNDTAYNLEPNIKDGPGGLRDIQTIAWVTQRHFDTASLHDLVAREFLSEEEYRTLVRGRDHLWTVRAGLHHLAGRREDRLLFDHQRALAKLLGYEDKPGILAVEQFMKHHYRAVQELSLLNEILLQHFQEVLLARGRARIKTINRRFQSHNGYLEVRHPKVFERAPYALLELFLVMQQRPELKGVRADTIRLVRANLHRLDTKFRADLAARSLFMEIMRQPRGITHELRRMNAYGVLGAYLPAFGRIVGQMQHDLFHVYTVDQHSLFVVRNLRRLTVAEYRHELPFASELIQRVFKPERLYLAGLFHDIAKGRGGDHSELGESEAEAFGRLHNLSEYDTRFVCWLVRHHLLMSWTAQREDVSDPEVVFRFAQKVGDQERLDNLYLLTVADMRGTSPAVWNAWKGRLLSQLYSATTRLLRRGIAEPLDLEAHIADLKREAAALLRHRHLAAEVVQHFWQNLEADYFLPYDADSLAWHAAAIARTSSAELPVVATRYAPELGGSEFLFYTPDREDLFVIITGGFDRLNLSIQDARIHTLRNGFALDTFVVLDHEGQAVSDPRQLAQLQKAMREQLLEPKPGRDLAAARLPRQLQHFPIGTRAQFAPAPNKPLTLMEVTAQDRPGLLYQVALALKHCRVNLVAAKVATYGERAEDIFFINTRDGAPVPEAQQKCLEAEVVRRLEPTPAKPEARSVEF